MKTNKDKKSLLEALKENHIILAACRKTGIGKSSFYRWQREDPKFAVAAEEAIKEGVALVNDAAESNIVSEIKNRDKDASKFWLTHRHPAYAAKLQVNASIHEDEAQSPEQARFIKRALSVLESIDQEKPDDQGGSHEQKT